MATNKKTAGKSTTKNWYVYFLIDPRTNEIFYVGKGTGKRCHCHVSDAKHGRGLNPAKERRINEILHAGFDVKVHIFQKFTSEAEAFDCEKRQIAKHKGEFLTNILGGHWSGKELMREKCRDMLQRMKPKDQWLRDITEDQRKLATVVFGSPGKFYDMQISAIRSELENPTPNIVRMTSNGIQFDWAR